MERARELAHANGETSDENPKEGAELDGSSLLTKAMESRKNFYERMSEEYDIYVADTLPYYEPGDSIRPQLLEAVRKSLAFFQEVLAEDQYSEQMARAPVERCEFLVRQNRHILLRDKEWEKIFDDITSFPESFGRYYPMVRVVADKDSLRCMVRALVVNDALYSYVSRLVDEANE